VELIRDSASEQRLRFSVHKGDVISQELSVPQSLEFSRHLLKPYSIDLSYEETAEGFQFSLIFPGLDVSRAA
jgi:hypothetical protein